MFTKSQRRTLKNKIWKGVIEMIIFLGYVVFLAVVLALWEIQIEGRDGWAGKLPCWKVEKGWIVKILGGRALTGYHFFMSIFLILVIHLPVFFATWSWKLESLLLGSLIGLVLVEDFCWFIFNPHYGLKNFKKGRILWHRNWWGPVPDFYWWYGGASIILILLSKK